MTNLRAIHASFNKIEHVSDSIKKFDKLQSLRLNDNCIAKMPNLTEVCLFNFVFILFMNPSGITHPWKVFVQNRVMTQTDFWKTHPFLVMGRVLYMTQNWIGSHEWNFRGWVFYESMLFSATPLLNLADSLGSCPGNLTLNLLY